MALRGAACRGRTLCITGRNHFLQRKRLRIAKQFSVAWSVVCLSVFLSHSCPVLKPFDGCRCHLANTLVGSNDTLC